MCAFGSLRDIYTRSKNKRDENPPEGERARTNRVALMTFLITARLSMRANIYAQWSFVYPGSDVADGFLPFSIFIFKVSTICPSTVIVYMFFYIASSLNRKYSKIVSHVLPFNVFDHEDLI